MTTLRDAALSTVSLVGLLLLAGCVSQTALLADPICEDEHIPAPAAPDRCRVVVQNIWPALEVPAGLSPSFRRDWLATNDKRSVFWDAWAPGDPQPVPVGVTVAATSSKLIFVHAKSGGLPAPGFGIIERGSGLLRWTGQPLSVVDTREHGDMVYVLGHGLRAWVLLRVAPDLTIETVHRLRLDRSDNLHLFYWGHVTLAVSKGGEPALAWQRREGGVLQLMVWRARADAPIVVDTLVQTPRLAEGSVRAEGRVTLTPHGASGFAVAWRPLVDCGFEDFGGPGSFPDPESRARAEVRWGVVGETKTTIRRWETMAYAPDGGMGMGPWPFTGLQIMGTQIDGRAVFVWNRNGRNGGLMAVPADAATPTHLAVVGGASRQSLLTFAPGEITVLSGRKGGLPRYALGLTCDAPAGPAIPVGGPPAVGPIDLRERVSPR